MFLAFVTAKDAALTAVSFGVPVVAGYAASLMLRRAAVAMAARENRAIGSLMPSAIRLPVVLLGWMAGLYAASLFTRGYELDWIRSWDWQRIDQWMLAVATLLCFFVAYRVVLFGARIASAHSEGASAGLPLIRKVLGAIFIVIATVTILNQFGVNIGPVLASLGILGVAAALAVQETLGNYFAGVVLALDRPLREGDFIRLENGQEGYVESIGWRATRIRPQGETTVIVPNSKLTTGIVTNSFYPDLSVRVYVDCGVSYESDLEAVERVCVDVAKEVAKRVEGADAEFQPFVRFKDFGENNVRFAVTMRCQNHEASLVLKSEFIKVLHARFVREGIVINYPVRQVINVPVQNIQTQPAAEPGDVI